MNEKIKKTENTTNANNSSTKTISLQKLKDLIDEHPVSTLITTLITTFGIGFGVAMFTTNLEQIRKTQVLEQRISELEGSLKSISRDTGGEPSYYDITKRLIENHQINQLDESSVFYPQNRFYIDRKLNDRTFKHSKMSELDFINLLNNNRLDTTIYNPIYEIPRNTLIDLWTLGDSVYTATLRKAYLINSIELKSFPYIRIYRLNFDELKKLYKRTYAKMDSMQGMNLKQQRAKITSGQEALAYRDSLRSLMADFQEREKNEKIIDRAMGKEYVNQTLEFEMNQGRELRDFWDNVEFEIISVQKKTNVLYFRSQYRFLFEKGQGDVEKVFLDKETFCISTNKSYINIQISVPSRDGRSVNFSRVTEWLSSLIILND